MDRLNEQERERLGQRLWAARYLAHLPRAEVAHNLGVNVNTVLQWERGSVPTPERRAALADLYATPERTLFAEVAAHEAEARDLLRPA